MTCSCADRDTAAAACFFFRLVCVRCCVVLLSRTAVLCLFGSFVFFLTSSSERHTGHRRRLFLALVCCFERDRSIFAHEQFCRPFQRARDRERARARRRRRLCACTAEGRRAGNASLASLPGARAPAAGTRWPPVRGDTLRGRAPKAPRKSSEDAIAGERCSNGVATTKPATARAEAAISPPSCAYIPWWGA